MHCNTKISARLLMVALLFLHPYLAGAEQCFCLKSASEKTSFQLKISLPQDDWKRGTVQYKGSKGKINIVFVGSKELERYEGRPSYMRYTWNEVVKGKVTGTYVLCIQGAMIYDSWYQRAKDHKKFVLERVIPDDECSDCI